MYKRASYPVPFHPLPCNSTPTTSAAQRLNAYAFAAILSTPHGRFPDKLRQALSKSRCQVRAPLNGRKAIAASGDATEHGVMLLHRATAPYPDSSVAYVAGESDQSDERRLKTNAPSSDSPGAYLAGESEQSDERRLKTNAPFTDSPAAAPGEADPLSGGHESTLPFLRMVEHFRWSRLPQSESFSHLVHIPPEVWGKDSTVVTTGELPTTNAGLGSPLLSLGMVEHFRWSRLPHREIFSRPRPHPPRKYGAVAESSPMQTVPQGRTPNIGTGVAVIMHKQRPGPSISSPPLFRHPVPRRGAPCGYPSPAWGRSP